jgi:hypothetical protein
MLRNDYFYHHLTDPNMPVTTAMLFEIFAKTLDGPVTAGVRIKKIHTKFRLGHQLFRYTRNFGWVVVTEYANVTFKGMKKIRAACGLSAEGADTSVDLRHLPSEHMLCLRNPLIASECTQMRSSRLTWTVQTRATCAC